MTDRVIASLGQLIESPFDYQGKKLQVTGFCVLNFEVKALYVSEADRRAAATTEAIWLEVPLSVANQKLSEAVALVEGTFDATTKGHLGRSAGTLKNVERLERLDQPDAST